MNNINSILPKEVLSEIFKLLCVHELSVLKFVCKEWKYLTETDYINKYNKIGYLYK